MSNNTPIACHEFATELWLLVGEEMPEERRRLWQRHLQNCVRCQKTLMTAQAVQAQYMRLPLYEAPEGLVRRLAQQAKLQKEKVGWLEKISRWFSTLSWRYDFKPRRVIVGVGLAALVLMFFHQLAFQPEIHHSWEAGAFDQKVSELWSTLGQYDDDLSRDQRDFYGLANSAAISIFDEQVSDLRESLSTMSSELSRAKL
jgi:hypothetical protein